MWVHIYIQIHKAYSQYTDTHRHIIILIFWSLTMACEKPMKNLDEPANVLFSYWIPFFFLCVIEYMHIFPSFSHTFDRTLPSKKNWRKYWLQFVKITEWDVTLVGDKRCLTIESTNCKLQTTANFIDDDLKKVSRNDLSLVCQLVKHQFRLKMKKHFIV